MLYANCISVKLGAGEGERYTCKDKAVNTPDKERGGNPGEEDGIDGDTVDLTV